MQIADTGLNRKTSFFEEVEKRVLHLFRLTNEPVVKVYHGYGNVSQMIVFGHVFSLSPLPRKKYRKNFWTNTFALIRSFMVVRLPDVAVRMVWEGTVCETTTAKDGFFRFEWKHQLPMTPGIYKVQVQYYSKQTNTVFATGIGS